jgi:hypothetical protein
MFRDLPELIKVDFVSSLRDCVDSMQMKTYDPEGLARSLVRCHRPEYSDIAKHVKDTLPSVYPSEFEFKSTTSVKLDSVGGESCCQVMLEVLPKVRSIQLLSPVRTSTTHLSQEDGATWLKGPPVFVQAKATLSGNPPTWSSVISGRSWNK